MEIFTRKIGRNRGKPRLWIEGKHLTAAGFSKGDKFRLVESLAGLLIEKAEDGNRTISGRPDRPIVDILGGALGAYGHVPEVTIMYRPGTGVLMVYTMATQLSEAA